jgi:hypothetical protein
MGVFEAQSCLASEVILNLLPASLEVDGSKNVALKSGETGREVA